MRRAGIGRAGLVAPLLALAAPAAAEPWAEAFTAGRFAEAASAGRAAGSVAALITAGRATSTLAAWRTPDRTRARELLLAAEADFARALALDPGNPEALLQQAIAIGYRAKLENSPGLARQARRQFEAVLERRPADPLALGALGGWHGEAVATLGRLIAGTALGAREREALAFFDRALATTGGDPAVPVFAASTLLALSAEHAPLARALLDRALKAEAGDGFERLMQEHARAILAPLAAGDVAAARATAKRLSPLGTVR